MLSRLLALLSVMPLMTAVGCAAQPSHVTPELPPPATFQISATLSANLTPQLVAQTGLPQTIKGTLEATARSEAISADPLRSRHQGHMSLTVTDGSGQKSLVDINIAVSGDSAGSPTEGLGETIKHFLDSASIIMAGTNSAQPTKPSASQ